MPHHFKSNDCPSTLINENYFIFNYSLYIFGEHYLFIHCFSSGNIDIITVGADDIIQHILNVTTT